MSRPSDSTGALTPVREAIDIARVSWARPLATAYVRDFESVAPFFRGQSTRTGGVARDDRASAARAARPRAARRRAAAPVRSARARRRTRSRPPPNSASQRASRSSPASRPACSAVRSTRCSRRSPRFSWRGASASTTACRRCRCSGWKRKITTGRRSDRRAPRRRRRAPRGHGAGSARRGRAPGGGARRSTSASRPRWRRSSRSSRRTSSREEVMAALRRALSPGAGMATAFARWLDDLLGQRRPRRL